MVAVGGGRRRHTRLVSDWSSDVCSSDLIVGEAANGSEALTLTRQSMPDVLLLDVSMPVMTGFDVLRELAPLMHNVRCILLTAGIDRAQTIQIGRASCRERWWL